MATHNIAGPRVQQEIQHPLHVVVRADGRFPYRPEIVCPRPERKYLAQIGLREMEEQATRTAPVHRNIAKWSLEALASKAESHFAHLRSPVAVMNCTLCRTSTAGAAVLDWVMAVTSTNPAGPYPICSPMPRPKPTSQTSSDLSDDTLENTAEITSNTTPWSDVRSQMVYRGDELWKSIARKPLLPDRDGITTKAWSKAYSLNLTSSLEDEEGETILWPRGVGIYEFGSIRNVVGGGCVTL